jgi:hypothetical protein
METGKHNIKARQGSTFNFNFTISTDDVAWPLLETYSAAMQVRASVTSSKKILSLTSGSGITLGATTGGVAVTVSAATMAAIPASTYVYDFELTYPDGTVVALLEGKFTISAEVTK